jgi:hypothetical protein
MSKKNKFSFLSDSTVNFSFLWIKFNSSRCFELNSYFVVYYERVVNVYITPDDAASVKYVHNIVMF